MGFLIDTGASPDTAIAGDTIDGEEHQAVKLEVGEPGSATPVSNTSPMPVREPKRVAAPAFAGDVGEASGQLLPADGARDMLAVWHDGTDGVVYLGLGEPARVGFGPRLPAGGQLTIKGITTAVNAISSGATGASVHVSGFSA